MSTDPTLPALARVVAERLGLTLGLFCFDSGDFDHDHIGVRDEDEIRDRKVCRRAVEALWVADEPWPKMWLSGLWTPEGCFWLLEQMRGQPYEVTARFNHHLELLAPVHYNLEPDMPLRAAAAALGVSE